MMKYSRASVMMALVVGFLLGAWLGQPAAAIEAAPGSAAPRANGMVYVGVINTDGALLHVSIDPRIPPNAVEIFYGRDVVIYNALGTTATPQPGGAPTPTRSATPPALTPTPALRPTATPIAIWRATVRKFPRLLVMSQPGGGQVGAVGYGAVLEIVEERNWWGRIEWPVAGWVDLTWCEVTHE